MPEDVTVALQSESAATCAPACERAPIVPNGIVPPRRFAIELTTRCNLKCVICQREKYEAGIGGPGIFRPLSNLSALEPLIRDADVISLTGFGEPLMYPQLREALETIFATARRRDILDLTTNGTMLSRKVGRWMKGHLSALAISLNAARAETYWRDMHPHEFARGRDM